MAEQVRTVAGVGEEGVRLDACLAGCPGVRSRNQAQQMIAAGAVRVNGRPQAKNYQLSLGDVVEYASPEADAPTVDPEDIPLDIVYLDDDIVVVNKPAGMVVHPGAGNYSGTLVNALLSKVKLCDIGAPLRPGIVHRLDKDTSGLLVAAKTDAAYFSLVEMIKKRQAQRVYLALVEGLFADERGRIEAPIGRDIKNRKAMAVGGAGAKEAITEFKVLSQTDKFSLLRVALETGRTHQIRVHLRYINHPIVGDKVYGRPGAGARLGLERPWLHAYKLEFPHPTGKNIVGWEQKPPEELLRVLTELGLVWE